MRAAETVAGSEYPKVLLIMPCAFNPVTGGGITFSNLFRGWPKDRIATAHNDAVPTSDDICAHYFILGPDEIKPIFPFNLRKTKAAGHAGGPAEADGPNGNAGRGSATPPLKALAKRLYESTIGTAGIPDQGILSTRLAAWIEDFKPDILYSILGSLAFLDLVMAIKQRFDLPLAIHLMDDGVTDPLRRGLFARRIRRAYALKFAQVLPLTQLRMGICKKMCAAYAERYGRTFLPFQNTVDVEKWARYAKSDLATAAEARIIYMGSIYSFAQLQSLIDFCAAVKRMRAGGTLVRFDLYTPLKLFSVDVASLPDSESVFVHDTITDDAEYFRILGAADALVLPVNFDPLSIHFIRYSMPTKVPSYLCSGTPILVYGPREVAQVEYALEDGWAKVVDRRDPADLETGLANILRDGELRGRVSAAARAMALRNHDAPKVRSDFQARLRSMAGREMPAAVPGAGR